MKSIENQLSPVHSSISLINSETLLQAWRMNTEQAPRKILKTDIDRIKLKMMCHFLNGVLGEIQPT
jgi:hypothetical protein